METITIKPAEVLVVKITPVVGGGGGGTGGASDIGDLTSVTITNPQNGDVLLYNGSAWVNTPNIATESYVDSQISSVQTQITNNDTEIASLQTQITSNDTEIASLQTEVASNDTDITNLQAADVTLQNNIDAEEADRIAFDNAFLNSLNLEQNTRISEDANLQLQINNLSLDSLTDVDLTTTAPANGEALIYDSTSTKWIPQAVSGSGAGTDLTASYTATSVTVQSSTGSDVTLSAANSTNAGVMLSADKAKIDTINFAADVNVSAVPSGGNAGNYAIVWDATAGEWQQKIPTLPTLNYIENVVTGSTSTGAILTYNGTSNKWEASTNSGTTVIGDIANNKQIISNIEGILKYSANTQLFNTSNDTTKAYLDLGSTASFLGVNNTGFSVDKNSPGIITLSVDSGASGLETNFDALVVSGTTTTNTATTTIKQGNTLQFAVGANSARLTPPTSLSSDVGIRLPSSDGTLALASDVPSSINDLTDTPASLGTAGQVLAVDSAGTATEWVTPSGGSGGGLGTADQTLTADRTITTSGYNLDVAMTSGDTVTFHNGINDLFQIDTNTTGTLFSVNDVSGLPQFSVNSNGMLKQAGGYPLNIVMITATANFNTAAQTFFPIGTAENPNSTLTGSGDYESHFCAPYNGKLLKIICQFSLTDPGTTVVGFHKASNAGLFSTTPSATVTATPTWSSPHTNPTVFDFTGQTTDFAAGDVLAFSFDATNNVFYASATFVFAVDPSNNY